MKQILIFLVLLISISVNVFANNELTSGYFLPRYSVLNSSSIGNDTASLLLNPATLYRLDRVNAVIITGTTMNANFVGVSATFSYIGGVSIGLYNIPTFSGTTKQGMFFGWGREFIGSLSAGFSMKTAATSVLRFDQGLFFDFGFLFYPNKTLGGIFEGEFFNNRLFISTVLQNIGVEATGDLNEEINLRLGFHYDIREIWTKIYLEKSFIMSYQSFSFGFEFAPLFKRKNTITDEEEKFKIFSIRTAYDVTDNDVKFGLAVHGRDINIDASYSINRNEFFIALNGYFEKSRGDISKDLYIKGSAAYSEARKLEKIDQEAALESYKYALEHYKLSLYYDKNNQTSIDKKTATEEKLEAYYEWFVSAAQKHEKNKKYISALKYYIKATLIEKEDDIQNKITELSTNSAVIIYVEEKNIIIDKYIESGEIKKATKELNRLISVVPNDKNIYKKIKENDKLLIEKAEELYNEAKDYFAKYKYEKCIASSEQALTYNPYYQEASELLKKAKGKHLNKKYLTRAQNYFKQGKYISVLSLTKKILRYNPRYKAAKSLQAKATKILTDNINIYLSKGKGLYSSGKYKQAIREFDKILTVSPRHSIAKDYKKRALSKIKAIKQLESLGD